MKNLKGNAMMQEMSLQEMKETNGGGLVLVVLGTLAVNFIWECINEPGDCIDGFRDGANSNFK
ncbi:hypothetical protein [Bacteroides timonensis]|uniref:hypothetical protein n=1 Tax=Bacteroides timonensis TaxID=1470345 RepID=UPI0004BB4D4F|nr:hypothetical protein [Bacteroides timonensis]